MILRLLLLGWVFTAPVWGVAGSKRCPVSPGDSTRKFDAKVLSIADGDTMKVKLLGRYKGKTAKVRLLGIDTPETHYQERSQGVWGEKAASFLSKTTPVGTRVQLELADSRCDNYGRLLAHIWKKGKHVNRMLVNQGYAVNYCIYPETRYCREFGKLTDEAIRDRRGFWGSKTEVPYVWRRKISGRPESRYVGNIYSYEVFPPRSQGARQLSVGSRIYFYNVNDMKPPFRMAAGGAPSQPVVTGSRNRGCPIARGQSRSIFPAKLIDVADGDTIGVRIPPQFLTKRYQKKRRIKIRMLGIDTPEAHYQGRNQGVWAENATRALKKMLEGGQSIRLEVGEEKCDRYGRVLAHVWKGTKNINAELLKQGLAVNYCIAPETKYCRRYGKIVKRQMANSNGFWGSSTEVPYVWRRKISGRSENRYVGDVFTRKVYEPKTAASKSVPVWSRVFFYKKEDIKKPFRLTSPK